MWTSAFSISGPRGGTDGVRGRFGFGCVSVDVGVFDSGPRGVYGQERGRFGFGCVPLKI